MSIGTPSGVARAVTAGVLLSCLLTLPESLRPAEGRATATSVEAHALEPAALDLAIEDVLAQPEYAWQLDAPRRRQIRESAWMKRALEGFKSGAEVVWNWIADNLVERLRRAFNRRSDRSSGSQIDLDWIVVAACVGLLLMVGWLMLRSRRQTTTTVAVEAVSLEQLSEDEASADERAAGDWLDWAGELEREGRLRDAVRAVYLAMLSLLSRRGLLKLERFKSNHDYRRELERRSRAQPELGAAFRDGVRRFEGIWYGDREATTESLRAIAGTLTTLDNESAPLEA